MSRFRLLILNFVLVALIPQVSFAENPPPCEFLLRRGARTEVADIIPDARMTDAATRERVRAEINGPTPEERDEVFRNAPYTPKGPPATPFARAAIGYLLKHPEWTPYQRAVIWELFAVDLIAFPDFSFRSVYHEGTDGSHLFVGSAGEAIVFAPNGKIYRGSHVFLKDGSKWKADYEDFFEIDGKPRDPRPFQLK